MSQKLFAHFEQKYLRNLPALRPGQTVRVHQKFKEGEKERSQIFEGLVIAISSGTGVGKTFTVRKLVDGVGVEKIFPFHSPMVTKVEVKKTSRVRRAKLYYLRGRTGKAAKLYEEKEAVKKESVEPAKEKAAA